MPRKPSQVELDRQKYERGICTNSGCWDAVSEGKAMCKKHLLENTRRTSEIRKQRIEAGLCIRCGKAPQRERAQTCKPCADRDAELRRSKRIAAGWKPPLPPTEEERAERKRISRGKAAKWMRETYHATLAQGICPRCKKEPVAEGRKRCTSCLAAASADTSRRWSERRERQVTHDEVTDENKEVQQ